MNQINVNPTHDHVEPMDASGDRTAAAGINMITVLIVLAVLAVIAWYLFTGPLRAMSTSGGTTNININPAAPTVVVNPPAQPQAPAPGGNTGTGTGNSATGTGSGATGGTSNSNPPASNP